MKNEFQILLTELDQIKSKSIARFNYRERMRMERILFIVLVKNIPFEVKGFSHENKKEIIKGLENYDMKGYKKSLVEKVFELRYLLKAISSGNPYEKYDAIFANNSNRKNIFDNIEMRIHKIKDLVENCD